MMSKQQTFIFDKFMQDLEKREGVKELKRKALERQEENWDARELLKRYREHPMNLRTYEK
jgi:hypothetical protein